MFVFASLVEPIFYFLESDYGYRKVIVDQRQVKYDKGKTYIKIVHTLFDEASLIFGFLVDGSEEEFDINVLIRLMEPNKNERRDSISSEENLIVADLNDLARLIKFYGQRFLKSDPYIYADMQYNVECYWNKKNEVQIRERASFAFASHNFTEALKQYFLLGNARTQLDNKRMAICEKNI